MDKNIIIKLSLTDIFPSLEEIEKNYKEGISIIFQGLSIFYDLKDLIINKKVIYLNQPTRKNTLIISLVQSINILATGLLNIKQGKQWITFNYETKKKYQQSNLAYSLIDCIKINISCFIIYNNTENYNSMNIINKKELSKKNKIIPKKNSKLFGSKKFLQKNSKNKQNNISQEHNLISSYNYNYNGREPILSINNDKNIYSKLKSINSFSTLGKENKKNDLNSSLSSLSFSSNKFKYGNNNNNNNILEQNTMYSTIRQKFNNYNRTIFTLNDNALNNISNNKKKNNCNNAILNEFDNEPKLEIKEEHNLLKKNKTKNELDINKVLNKVHKKQKSCTGLKIVDSKTQLRNINSGERQSFKNHNDSFKKIMINNNNMTRKKINSIIATNNNNNNNNNTFIYDRNSLYNISFVNTKSFYHKKNELLNSFQKDDNNKNCKDNFITEKKNNVRSIDNLHYSINDTISYNNKNLMTNSNNKNNNLKHYMSENFHNQNADSCEFTESDNFNKLKEDFLLLYSNDYVKNIKEDLLKLEIELFIEKTTELTKEYHFQLLDELLEYKIEKNKCNKYLLEYAKMNKLYNKLKSIKSNKEIKKNYMNENNKIIIKQNNSIFKLNMNEIKLYKILFNNNTNIIEKKKKLKKIFNFILDKNNIRNTNTIIINNKNSKEILGFIDKNKTIDNRSIIRTRIIPKNQQTKYNNNNQLNLTNSYVWENYNDKNEKNLNDIYLKTHKIFSPVIKMKDFNPSKTISQIINKFENSL